ncbi:hypothetical protein EAF04_008463 [Stromatinia cepivora]|nr:hypothetical protein EAF04_008463 [Stromatinia cepivora]
MEVLSYMQALDNESHKVVARNLRLGTVGYISWSAFFPKKPAQLCVCKKGCCRCEIEDALTYYAYKLAFQGKGTFSEHVGLSHNDATLVILADPIITDPTTLPRKSSV